MLWRGKVYPKNKSQQIISATNGAVIKNVTQKITYLGMPDKDFPGDTARILPNLMNQKIIIDRIKVELSKYFWKPPDIEASLSNAKLQGWNVPVWRYKGYVYVTWRHLVTTTRQVGENKVEESHPREESKQMYFEWLVPSISESSNQTAKILQSFLAVNTGKPSLRVAWKLPLMGRIVSNVLILFKRNKNRIDNAATMFTDPLNLPKQIKRDKNSPRILGSLQPDITLNNSLSRLNSQVELHLRNIIGAKSNIQNFQQKIQIESIEECWVPIWLIYYEHNRENRFAAFNGYSAKPVNLVLPVSFRAEILAWFIALLVWFGVSNLTPLFFLVIVKQIFGWYFLWLIFGCLMSFPILFGIATVISLRTPKE